MSPYKNLERPRPSDDVACPAPRMQKQGEGRFKRVSGELLQQNKDATLTVAEFSDTSVLEPHRGYSMPDLLQIKY